GLGPPLIPFILLLRNYAQYMPTAAVLRSAGKLPQTGCRPGGRRKDGRASCRRSGQRSGGPRLVHAHSKNKVRLMVKFAPARLDRRWYDAAMRAGPHLPDPPLPPPPIPPPASLRSPHSHGFVLSVVLLLAASPVSARDLGEAPSEFTSARQVAARLAALGPRSEAEARKRAVDLLLDALRRVGLERVRAVRHEGLINVEGVLPGEVPEEIVLSAHYDSVAGSPGAGDDASGCGLAIAAVADLRRTPLRHTVRVVLFDGEETGTRGSRAWLASLAPEARDRMLADLNVEMVGWSGSGGAVILSLPARHPGSGERKLAPGWLVHAVLRSGEAVEWPFAVADNRFPLLAQLVFRSARILYGSDSESFLKWDVPSVTLYDSSFLAEDPAYHRFTDVAGRLDARRLARWTQVLAAAVRRLDALAGRPLPEDQYLVLFRRVWLRRDLIWIGFLLWVL